jgi:hypothetical protein
VESVGVLLTFVVLGAVILALAVWLTVRSRKHPGQTRAEHAPHGQSGAGNSWDSMGALD